MFPPTIWEQRARASWLSRHEAFLYCLRQSATGRAPGSPDIRVKADALGLVSYIGDAERPAQTATAHQKLSAL